MKEKLISDKVSEYMNSLLPPRPAEMQTMEAYARKTGFPIIGPVCGYLCYQLARLIHARRVFELGSGYGYSTAWFAQAVKDNGGGKVYHVVWDKKLSDKAKMHLTRLGYDAIMVYKVSEAVKALKKTRGLFDIIFNDIDKEGYPDSLSVISQKLRSGGLLIVDNVLWDGRIFDKKNEEGSTEAIRTFTQRIVHDPQWVVTLIPIRDGLLIAYKK